MSASRPCPRVWQLEKIGAGRDPPSTGADGLGSGSRSVETHHLTDGVVPLLDALRRAATLGPAFQDDLVESLLASGDILGRGLDLDELAGLADRALTRAGGASDAFVVLLRDHLPE